MAMTKREIYARYGIEYDGDNHILWRGVWIPELLKEGNTKVGKTVWTWSMTPGIDGTCVCTCDGCYAMTGRYLCDNVKESNRRNQQIVEEDLDFFYRAVMAQLECIGTGEVRIHAAGDFATANQEAYATMWWLIVRSNPNFHFWTYTKVRELEHLFDDLPNGNIVKSVIDGVGVNFGHCGYIIDAYKKLKANGAKVWICRCGIDKNQHCANCTRCSSYDFVLFVEHSTSYKASADPRFDELKALIESQED